MIIMKKNNNRRMTMKAWAFVICLLSVSSTIAQNIPAFPGAEGHGRYVTGGRGGKVIHVTNLNDSGTGSFRNAVKGDAKKVVVFDVGGVIALKSNVNIGANTTIMGQTAPKPGITLRYYTVNPAGNNIIMRFIRIRRGQEKSVDDGADASTARHYTGIMIDHCSLSWSIDEVASFYDNNNFTMQWCTIGESLCNAGHNKGAHGYGGIWGGKLASFHHNLICHVNNRSPRFNGARYNWDGFTGNKLYTEYKWENAVQAENVDFRNCVIYNCGNGCYGGPGGGQINMVNNYYKSGPAGNTTQLTTVTVGASGNAEGYPIYWGMTSRYFIEGNLIDGRSSGWSNVNYDSGTITQAGVHYSKDNNHYYGSAVDYLTKNGTDYVSIKLDKPAPTGDVTTHSAATAFDKVLLYAGVSLRRDDVDDRYAAEAETGTATYTGTVTGKPGRIDKVSDVNGYTEDNFGSGKRPTGFDTDGDGISDAWELANGLNPNDATDANAYTVDTQGYYNNLEVYCNSLIQKIMLNGNADATQQVKDYYPRYIREDESVSEAINTPEQGDVQEVSYILSQSTNTGENTSSSYAFENGLTITNQKSKGYAAGKNDGLKYSANVQYTINLPADVTVKSITFTGYDNYDDTDSYLGEVDGVAYDATAYVFPKTKETVMHTISLSAAKEKITFTPQGKQVVLIITLNGYKGDPAGISVPYADAASHRSSANIQYNLAGQPVGQGYHGIVIQKGKKVMAK